MKIRVLFLAAMLCALCVGQASALEYTMEAPDDYLFARPTSDETIYEWENPNVDRSKNTALIPPTFGSPTSYLPGSGTPLTPNLVPGALDGGLVTQMGPCELSYRQRRGVFDWICRFRLYRSDLRPLLRQRQPGYPENSGHRPERQGL